MRCLAVAAILSLLLGCNPIAGLDDLRFDGGQGSRAASGNAGGAPGGAPGSGVYEHALSPERVQTHHMLGSIGR